MRAFDIATTDMPRVLYQSGNKTHILVRDRFKDCEKCSMSDKEVCGHLCARLAEAYDADNVDWFEYHLETAND